MIFFNSNFIAIIEHPQMLLSRQPIFPKWERKVSGECNWRTSTKKTSKYQWSFKLPRYDFFSKFGGWRKTQESKDPESPPHCTLKNPLSWNKKKCSTFQFWSRVRTILSLSSSTNPLNNFEFSINWRQDMMWLGLCRIKNLFFTFTFTFTFYVTWCTWNKSLNF